MWTSKNRGRYDRSALRYPSDLTDDEWALIEPLIRARRGGCKSKRHVDEREVINGIDVGLRWDASGGRSQRPTPTIYGDDYLDLWSYDGTLDRIHHALYVECRERGKHEASPPLPSSIAAIKSEKRGPCIYPHGF